MRLDETGAEKIAAVATATSTAMAEVDEPPTELSEAAVYAAEESDETESEEEPEVMLGFAVEPEGSLARNHFPSKLGGAPAWLDPVQLPTASTLTCAASGLPMRFLLQLYAARESDGPHAFPRSLYLFISPRGAELTARGAVRALRCQLPRVNPFYPSEPPEEGDAPRQLLPEEDRIARLRSPIWAAAQDRADDRSAGDADEASVAAVCAAPAAYREWELVVEPEPEGADVAADDPAVARLVAEYKRRSADADAEGCEAGGGADDAGEATEAAALLGAVPAEQRTAVREFSAFTGRIGRAPRQCIRYCDDEAAEPMWALRSGRAPDPVPPCGLCGAPRRFEFQESAEICAELAPRAPSLSQHRRLRRAFVCAGDAAVPPCDGHRLIGRPGARLGDDRRLHVHGELRDASAWRDARRQPR